MKEYLVFNFSDFTIYVGVMQGLKIIEESFGQDRNVVDDLLNIAKVICFPIYEILVRLSIFLFTRAISVLYILLCLVEWSVNLIFLFNYFPHELNPHHLPDC